jgi:hypothetical protein
MIIANAYRKRWYGRVLGLSEFKPEFRALHWRVEEPKR